MKKTSKKNKKNENRKCKLPLDIDHSYAFRIIRLVNLLSKRYQLSYEKEYDLTLVDWRILLVVAYHPCISAIEVCAMTGYSEMNVSRSVRHLEKMKRLTRTKDKADKRRTMLQLSKSGWDVYNRIIPNYIATETKLISSLSKSELSSLNKILSKMMDQVLDMPMLKVDAEK